MTIATIKEQLSKDKIKHVIRLNNTVQVDKQSIYDIKDLHLRYGDAYALKGINMTIYDREVTAIIGPSGCGKSSFLKTLNRLVEHVPNVQLDGQIMFQGQSVFSRTLSPVELRTRVGMVFQKANPFPKSIYENIAYGPKIHGIRNKKILDQIVESSLKKYYLWDEVKDSLSDHDLELSG